MSDDYDYDYDDDEVQTPVYMPDQMDGPNDRSEFYDTTYGAVASATTPTIHYINESGLPDDVVMRHFSNRGNVEISSVIEKWSQSLSSASINQSIDVFNRNKFRQGETHIHAIMSRVAWAVENDDILSTLADVVEGLTWQKCRFELIDEDQQDIWNQWATNINLDGLLRQMGREEFKVSQFYVGLWWAKETYKVQEDEITDQLDDFELQRELREYDKKVKQRNAFIDTNKATPGFVEPPEIPEPDTSGPGRGNRTRKKVFPLTVPTDVTIFDPTKVLPVGTLMFGRERFAYIANRAEHLAFSEVMAGNLVDDTVMQLIEGPYKPTQQDLVACGDLSVDAGQLWLFRSEAIFRHTQTRADYERYSPVRLKTILPLIEMKEHLRASDRAALIGNTNFIVVITKGTDKLPAKPAEIANLQEQARVIARLPVLIGDHRLKVEIVSPSTDNTLIESRWETLDSRLIFAALRSFSPVVQGGGGGGGVGVDEMSRVISKNLESRRHMIARTLQAKIFRLILDKNPKLDEMPSLVFAPKRITLDFSADIINSVLKLRDRGDISRETTLEELDYDQDTEVLRRAREKVLYDDVFDSATPHSSPAANPFAPAQPGVPVDPTVAPGAVPPPPAVPGPAAGTKKAARKVAKKAAAGNPNLGPNGQSVREGGRPPGVKETEPRNPAGQGAKKR